VRRVLWPIALLLVLVAAAFALVTAACAAPATAPPATASAPATRSVGEILISERAATALSAVAGDTIEVSTGAAFTAPERYRVAAVYRPEADPNEVGRDTRFVRLHADDLERLSGQSDAVQRIVVRLRDPARAAEVRDRLQRSAVGFDAYTSDELARHTSQTFEVIARFQRAIAWLTLVAGAVFVITLMVLKVDERRRELAALRLLGLSRRTILGSLLLEALVLTALGALVGVAFGRGASALINGYFTRYYRTDLVFSRVTADVAWTAVALALPIGLGAAAIAAWRLLRRRDFAQGAR
jgi:putative ABC transport system permease protein